METCSFCDARASLGSTARALNLRSCRAGGCIAKFKSAVRAHCDKCGHAMTAGALNLEALSATPLEEKRESFDSPWINTTLLQGESSESPWIDSTLVLWNAVWFRTSTNDYVAPRAIGYIDVKLPETATKKDIDKAFLRLKKYKSLIIDQEGGRTDQKLRAQLGKNNLYCPKTTFRLDPCCMLFLLVSDEAARVASGKKGEGIPPLYVYPFDGSAPELLLAYLQDSLPLPLEGDRTGLTNTPKPIPIKLNKDTIKDTARTLCVRKIIGTVDIVQQSPEGVEIRETQNIVERLSAFSLTTVLLDKADRTPDRLHEALIGAVRMTAVVPPPAPPMAPPMDQPIVNPPVVPENMTVPTWVETQVSEDKLWIRKTRLDFKVNSEPYRQSTDVRMSHDLIQTLFDPHAYVGNYKSNSTHREFGYMFKEFKKLEGRLNATQILNTVKVGPLGTNRDPNNREIMDAIHSLDIDTLDEQLALRTTDNEERNVDPKLPDLQNMLLYLYNCSASLAESQPKPRRKAHPTVSATGDGAKY